MEPASGASPTRQLILDAAGRVVLALGVSSLTLDAVAHEAGVSKGGLLYHFPTKERLIEGMVRYSLDTFTHALVQGEAAETQDSTRGHWLRGYVRANFDIERRELDLEVALLTAMTTHPHLLNPFREAAAQWQARVESDGLDPALATTIRLAADGLYLADLLGIAPVEGELRAQVRALLLRLSEGGPA